MFSLFTKRSELFSSSFFSKFFISRACDESNHINWKLKFWCSFDVIANSHSLEGKYDYIIIGTDSGGPVMAARVSEDSTKTLLLLEMDSAENFISVITLVAIFLQKISIDWNFKTEPQIKSCFGLEARMSSSSRS